MYYALKSLLYPSRGLRKELSRENLLFIDPGLGGTGWAFFTKINVNGPPKPPASSGSFKPKSGGYWEKSAESIWTWYDTLVKTVRPKHIIIETPEAWLTSKKGLASVQRGDIFKTTYLIGGMGCLSKRTPLLVLPREWKGQLPKTVVKQRIKKKFKLTITNEHEMDAIGMGLAAQGGL